jgi:hypothetical protein
MGYTDHGLQADALFYYGDANCATTPYVASGIRWINNNINAVEQLIRIR